MWCVAWVCARVTCLVHVMMQRLKYIQIATHRVIIHSILVGPRCLDVVSLLYMIHSVLTQCIRTWFITDAFTRFINGHQWYSLGRMVRRSDRVVSGLRGHYGVVGLVSGLSVVIARPEHEDFGVRRGFMFDVWRWLRLRPVV